MKRVLLLLFFLPAIVLADVPSEADFQAIADKYGITKDDAKLQVMQQKINEIRQLQKAEKFEVKKGDAKLIELTDAQKATLQTEKDDKYTDLKTLFDSLDATQESK